MIKHFCDKCGKEMSVHEINYCNEMIGRDLCSKHIEEYNKFNESSPKIYKLRHGQDELQRRRIENR